MAIILTWSKYKMQANLSVKPIAAILLFLSFGLLMAYYSTGVLHPDEHYQVLEFSRWLMGLPFSEPWEATQKLRHPLLPYIMMLWIKPMLALGINNPATIAFVLRLLSFLLNASVQWYCIHKFASKLFDQNPVGANPCVRPNIAGEHMGSPLQKQQFKLYFILLPFFYLLWVRTSSESFSATSLILSLTLMLRLINSSTSCHPREDGDPDLSSKRFIHDKLIFFLAGFFTFLCFSFRFAVATAWAAHFYLLIQEAKQKRWLNWFWFSLGMGLGLLLFFAMEYRLYGVYFASPLAYFKFNILSGAAGETFGHDWGMDFIKFLLFFLFPFNFLIFKKLFNKETIIQFNQGATFQILFPLFIACYFLTLIHFKVGHKEMRFLFPMIPCLYIIFGYGMIKFNLVNKKTLGMLLLSQAIFCLGLGKSFILEARQISRVCNPSQWYYPAQQSRIYSTSGYNFLMYPAFYCGAPYEVWGFQLPNEFGINLFNNAKDLGLFLQHFEIFLPKFQDIPKLRTTTLDGWYYNQSQRTLINKKVFYYIYVSSFENSQPPPQNCTRAISNPHWDDAIAQLGSNLPIKIKQSQTFLLKCENDPAISIKTSSSSTTTNNNNYKTPGFQMQTSPTTYLWQK